MKNKYLLLFTLALSILISGCKKDKISFPEIETLSGQSENDNKILLKGNVVSTGSFRVIDYGFLYGFDNNLQQNYSNAISLGSSPKQGAFEAIADLSFFGISGRKIYARAYLTNEQGISYGAIIGVDIPVSSVSNLSPKSGVVGDLITVSGNFYTGNVNNVSVLFNNVKATIKEFSSSQIKFEIPETTNQSFFNNQVNVQVFINGQQIGNSSIFTLLPKIKSFAPLSGAIGSTISIAGSNFSNNFSGGPTIRFFLGTKEVTYQVINSSEIRVVVPDDLANLKFKISTIIQGVTTELPQEFEVLLPEIKSFSPSSGMPNTYVVVSGSNFPINYYSINYKLFLGGAAINFSQINSNSFGFYVPLNASIGDYDVELRLGSNNVKAPQKFKVIAPSITSFTPTSGSVGQEVFINGNFQPSTNYTVTIGNVQNSVFSSSSSNVLRINVPFGALVGPSKITLSTGGITIVSKDDFTVLSPQINSFTPTTGVAGTLVTIDGTGFSQFPSNNLVRFGTVATQVLNASPTKLTVLVPSGIPPSSMKITINVSGQTAVSTNNFILTN